MATYRVTDTELTQVADAIRAKGGTSAALTWPGGFEDAVEAIQGGGGGTEYVSGSMTEVTLEAAGWNGTTFTKTLTYTDPTDPVYTTNLQLGIPPTSSAANAEALRAAGITLPQSSQSTTTSESDGVTTTTVTVTLVFSAVYAPTADVRIGVYGLRGWAS